MFADGLGRDADVGSHRNGMRKHWKHFFVREESVKEKEKPYLQYRIGKMYASGLGAEQNYVKRRHTGFPRRLQWIISMPSILWSGFTGGAGGGKNDIRAFSLYMSSAEQGNPYATWNWRRCIGMVLVQSRIYTRQSGDFRMRIPVLWFWKKKSHDDKLPVPDWSDASYWNGNQRR